MKNSLKVLLVAALVAPLLALTGCSCDPCCDKPSYDKCGTKYDHCDGK